MQSTESWLLLCAFLDDKLCHIYNSAALQNLCRVEWRASLQFCLSVPTIEKVLKTAFDRGTFDPHEARLCQQELLAKSLDPKLTDTQARQLLQQCLLQEPVSANMPAAKVICKDIDDCVLDLCCTSVQGPGDLTALKMREATVYSALLMSAQGFVPDLARHLTGCADHHRQYNLHPNSKLSLLLEDCLMSQHATDASNLAAARLASACAMADASTYKLLLPWLEEMMWRGQQSRTQMLAAAGILDGLYLHLDSLEVSCWQHILTLMHQMLQSQQATSAGLSTAAAVGIGRLLMHSADACAELEQTEQLVALLVQSYVQPPASDTGRPGWQQSSQGFTAGNPPASSCQEDTQQALHLFFQQYSKKHVDDLANTCVLLVCDALADGILCWSPTAGVLCADSRDGRMVMEHVEWSGDAFKQARAVHLQCKFLARLVCQGHVPMQAVYDAVCANSPALGITADAVKDWLQIETSGLHVCWSALQSTNVPPLPRVDWRAL